MQFFNFAFQSVDFDYLFLEENDNESVPVKALLVPGLTLVLD